jgi:methylated-DNA-[protein]-cysteine S-methyltransferase
MAAANPQPLIIASTTPFGSLAVAVIDSRLAGVSMGHPTRDHATRRLIRILGQSTPHDAAHTTTSNERFAADVLDRLARFLDGEPVDLADIPLALDHLSPFQQRVVAACRAIPYGATRTYGVVAAAAGSAGAARAVGQVMAGNRHPLVVPCHRVVAAGGKLGGFSAPQGLTLKRRLLALAAGDVQTALSTAAPLPARLRQRRLDEPQQIAGARA